MNILCISSHSGLWRLHGLYEMSLLKGLALRGVDIHFYICNGNHALCSLNMPVDREYCKKCFASVSAEAGLFGLPFRPLYSREDLQNRQNARNWVDSLPSSALLQAEYAGLPLGGWMQSTLMTALRLPSYKVGESETYDALFRTILADARADAQALLNLLDAQSYDRILLFNGRIFATKLLFELGKQQGIPVFLHERGNRMGTMVLAKDRLPNTFAQFHDCWEEWKDIPLNSQELADTQSYFFRRARGDRSATNWTAFSTAAGRPEELRELLSSGVKRVWALFTSSTDEALADPGYDPGEFENQVDWLENVITTVSQFPDIHLVVRAHPNLAPTAQSEGSPEECAWFKVLKEKHQRNDGLTIFEPADQVSSYDLMSIADVGITYMSTCGLEMAAHGKPVATGAGTYYSPAGFAQLIDRRNSIKKTFDFFASLPPAPFDPEIKRKAWRFAYTYAFRFPRLFPLIHMPNPHEGSMTTYYDTWFRPMATPTLDPLVEAILSGEEPLMKPDDEAKNRSAAEEDAIVGEPGLGRPVRRKPSESSPQISVIMSVYNGEEHVEEAVESILAQTFANFEFIIVDDASTDSTSQALANMAAGDPRIKILRNERNMERAYSRNLAVQYANAPLLAIMDADDYAFPHRLERQVAFMRKHPEVALCAGLIEIYETGHVFQRPTHDTKIRLHLLRDSCLPHPTWMIRKEAFLAAAGYEHDFIPSEDYALLGKLMENPQVRFACLPEVLIKYRTYPEKDRRGYEEVQRRNAAKVRARLIRRLVPDVSEEKLSNHNLLCSYEQKAVDAHTLIGCRTWLKRLLTANEATNMFDRKLFQEFWLQRWWEICRTSLHAGMLWNLATGAGLRGLPRSELVLPMKRAFRYWLQKKLVPRNLRCKDFYLSGP